MTRVLIIDDDPQDRHLIACRLSKACQGVVVDEACTIEEGLKHAKEAECDVVLLDLTLRETDGLNTLRKFLLAESNVPVIVLTGSIDDELALKAIEAGAQDYIRKSDINNPWLFRCLKHAITRHDLQQELQELSMKDGLTNLPNRICFERQLKRNFDQQRLAKDEHFAVVFIDLNDFKRINDTYGHAAGDLALVEFAKRVRRCVRASDHVARFGGDEFVALLEYVRSKADVERFINRLQTSLEVPLELEATKIRLSASIGYVLSDDSYSGTNEMLEAADAEMYSKKKAPLNTRRVNTDRLASTQ